jgi:hypothetical protein
MSKSEQYECYTYEYKPGMGQNPICVYGWGTYERGSVLEGQSMKCFIDAYPDAETALAAYPDAQPSNKWIEPQVSLNHLPGENDPVSGGMYLDDFGGDNDSHYE